MPRVFDGTDQFLTTASTPISGFPFTAACWANADASAAQMATVAVTDTAGDANYWELYLEGTGALNDARVRSRDAGGFDDANTVGEFSTGTWHHLIGSEITATSRTVYLDEGTAGTNATDLTPAGLDVVSIGAIGRATPAIFFSGSLFWAALWNVELGAADRERLASGVEPIFVRRDALVFFSRCMADEDQDIIGGLALAPQNAPTVSNDFPSTMIRAAPRGRGRSRSRFE